MKLTPFFKVLTVPTPINGNFLVQFDGNKGSSNLWVGKKYSIISPDSMSKANIQVLQIGGRYRAAIDDLSSIKVEHFQEDLPMVHVGAKLMYDKNIEVEVMLIGDNDEVVIKENNGDLSICLGAELSPRKTKEELAVDEMFDCIKNNKAKFIDDTIKQVLLELVKAGYHK